MVIGHRFFHKIIAWMGQRGEKKDWLLSQECAEEKDVQCACQLMLIRGKRTQHNGKDVMVMEMDFIKYGLFFIWVIYSRESLRTENMIEHIRERSRQGCHISGILAQC